MALYYTLPVYKASYTLVHVLFRATSDFSREYKYTVGQDLKQEGMALIKNIYRANRTRDKAVALADARENVEMIRLSLRLMQDMGQVSLKKFVEINLGVENVSRQLTAWENSSKSKGITNPPESSGPARAQASVRSESNNPLALGKEYRPATGVLCNSI